MAYAPQGGWAIFDQQKQTSKVFSLANARLAEPSFVPRNKSAGEGDGYLIGVATYPMENNRADLVLLDLQNYDAGAIAKVKLPYPIVGQIHGFWTPGHELPPMKA
jgi:carotenoid cleavage dioxygenase